MASMVKETIRVAIDGPAAAGKSTVAKMVARKLSYIYIDTGAMYRALTLKVLNHNIKLDDEQHIANLLSKTEIKLVQGMDSQHVEMDGEDVTLDIRSSIVSNSVSYIAKLSSIRNDMVKRQQLLAEKCGVVMDGRDIGTQVLPDAEVKIFLRATVEERARRRYDENIQKGFSADLTKLKQEIEKRDLIDSKRDVSPLVKAKDAIEIDTTLLSIEQVVQRILDEVIKK